MEGPISPTLELALNLSVAGLVGLATGIEREWSGHASGPDARFAGARTFLLLGLLGGVAGLLLNRGSVAVAVVLLAGPAALAVAAFVVASSRKDGGTMDGTTETAALLVLALGVCSGVGLVRLAASCGAVMVLALREKTTVHRFIRRIDEPELRAGLQFAVLALVLLPLLPPGPYGPLGSIRPRELWTVVLLVSGLNFAGYLARRVTGPLSGTVLTGLLGGLFSSTAVTLTMSRQSREDPRRSGVLAHGVMAACLMLLPRLAVVTLALQPALTRRFLPFLVPQLLVAGAAVLISIHRGGESRTEPSEDRTHNPLRLGSALLLAAGFQVVLMLMAYVRGRFGDAGVLTTATLVGLTDMDALALSMSRLGSMPDMVQLAAVAMAVGLLANTLLKLGIVLLLGRGRFRLNAGLWLLGLAAASGIGFWIGLR